MAFTTHGDLQSGAVVATVDGIGLLGLRWSTGLPGDDLVRLVWDLELTIPRVSGWSRRLVPTIAEGYGDPTLPDRPWWTLRSIRTLLVAVASPNVPLRQRWHARHRLMALAGREYVASHRCVLPFEP
jgi:hypothetical protein